MSESATESEIIDVCDCGKIIYQGKVIGKLNYNPKHLMNEDGEITLHIVTDACGTYIEHKKEEPKT